MTSSAAAARPRRNLTRSSLGSLRSVAKRRRRHGQSTICVAPRLRSWEARSIAFCPKRVLNRADNDVTDWGFTTDPNT